MYTLLLGIFAVDLISLALALRCAAKIDRELQAFDERIAKHGGIKRPLEASQGETYREVPGRSTNR